MARIFDTLSGDERLSTYRRPRGSSESCGPISRVGAVDVPLALGPWRLLADDMGLGKTIQAIALLHQRETMLTMGPRC